jgi:hypothetical protein
MEKKFTTENRRHGDIEFISEVIDTSKLKKISKDNTFVLAEGETTNHFHTITAEKGTCEVFLDENANMVVEVNGKAILTHPEHKPLEFTTGTWRIDREQEYDYFSLKTRKVMD